jgi:MFS family permease
LRITLNVISVASLIIFFYSTSIPMLMLGMIIFGIFRAGGEVAWNLWVTKIAPPELVADYMSVHTLLTGVRGIFAPFLGFYAATVLPLQSIASISGCLLLGACLLLFPELRKSRDHQPGKVLVRNMGTRQ